MREEAWTGEESRVRASLLLPRSLLVSVSPEGAAGARFSPRMLPWVKVARAIRGFHVVSAGQLGNTGFHKESGCQNGKGGSSDFDIKQERRFL